MNSLFKSFVDYLNKQISNFITSYDKDNTNLNSMLKNRKLKIPISNFKSNISFDSINPDSNQLFTLIISEDIGKVTSSQSDITLDFGAYIPSLIKGDFSIYILSIVNEKLHPSISFEIDDKTGLPDTKYVNSIIVNNNNVIEPNELFAINVRIPKKSDEEDEEFSINFDLKLGNNNLLELKLPCNFKFILSALKISIECCNYKLIIKDNELHLGTTYLEENEIIDFKVRCLNENTKFSYKVSYKGNNDNEAKQPQLKEEKNKFSILLANEYNDIDTTDSNFSLKLFSAIFYVYITNEIFIPIIINSKIIPFKFKITAYDFYRTDNAVEKSLRIYYGKEQLGKEQRLFFKINIPGKKNIQEI